MRSFQRQDDFGRRESLGERLDTPSSSGFRRGMTTTGVIARKLETVYGLPAETPSAIVTALDAIDRTLCRSK